MIVEDVFELKDRGCVITTKSKDMACPLYVGDHLQCGDRVWKLVGIEHIRYAGPSSPPVNRVSGLLLQKCEGTFNWPSKGDDLVKASGEK